MALTKLNFSGQPTITSANMPTGSVFNTTQSLNTYQFSTSSTSFVDLESASGVAWETAITPTSSSNKILILPTLHMRTINSSGSSARVALTIQAKIGSGSPSTIFNTSVTNGRLGGYDYGGSGLQVGNYTNLMYLYSPSTTSEVKIRFQVKCDSGASVEHNSDNYDSLCVLQEVAG